MFPPPHCLVQVPVPLLPGIGLVHHHFVTLYFTTYNEDPCLSASHDVVGAGGIYVQPLLEPGRDFSSEERAVLQHLHLGGVQVKVRDAGGGVLPQDSDFHCCRGWKKSCEFCLLFIALTYFKTEPAQGFSAVSIMWGGICPSFCNCSELIKVLI